MNRGRTDREEKRAEAEKKYEMVLVFLFVFIEGEKGYLKKHVRYLRKIFLQDTSTDLLAWFTFGESAYVFILSLLREHTSLFRIPLVELVGQFKSNSVVVIPIDSISTKEISSFLEAGGRCNLNTYFVTQRIHTGMKVDEQTLHKLQEEHIHQLILYQL